MNPSDVPTTSSPNGWNGIAMDPNGSYLYVTNGNDDSVSQYAIDPMSGELGPL